MGINIKTSFRRPVIFIALCMMVLSQAGCGTIVNTMGVGHGGPKKSMGGVAADGYIAYKGTMQGKPQYVLLLLDVPFSFVGDILTLPMTLSASPDYEFRHVGPSGKVFYKTYSVEWFTVYRIRGTDQTPRSKFEEKVIHVLRNVLKEYDIDDIEIGTVPPTRFHMGIKYMLTYHSEPDKLLDLALLNESEQEHPYETIRTELEEAFKKEFGDRFTKIEEDW